MKREYSVYVKAFLMVLMELCRLERLGCCIATAMQLSKQSHYLASVPHSMHCLGASTSRRVSAWAARPQ